MINTMILSINGFEYTLIDKKENMYKIKIDFQVDFKINVNDYLYLNINSLNTNDFYIFGELNSKYGRDISNFNNNEDICIIIKNSENNGSTIKLKRLYG